jgi:MFS family permease
LASQITAQRDGPAGRDGWVLAVCLARVFLFANFMTVAACVPLVMPAWGIGAAQAGSVVSSFTMSYAVSLFVTSWIADHFGAKRVALVSCWLAAAAAAAFGLFGRDYVSAFFLYGLAGLMQGGVYTPIVMLFAERYSPRRRGNAVGWLIGSTSIGYAGSLAAAGLGLALGGWQTAFLMTGLLPTVGAILLTAVLWHSPNTVHGRGGTLGLKSALLENRDARRLVAGYTAHSWELLGMWAWVPAFLAANLSLNGWSVVAGAGLSAYVAAAGHISGAVASLSMGGASDRLGRKAVLFAVAAASAVISLSIGWMVAIPTLILAPLVLVYAFLAIGDSAVLSTALTETVRPAYLGSALAIRSLCGFGAGALAPLAFGAILDLAGNGTAASPIAWGVGFAALGLGGIVAAWYALQLKSVGRSR